MLFWLQATVKDVAAQVFAKRYFSWFGLSRGQLSSSFRPPLSAVAFVKNRVGKIRVGSQPLSSELVIPLTCHNVYKLSRIPVCTSTRRGVLVGPFLVVLVFNKRGAFKRTKWRSVKVFP